MAFDSSTVTRLTAALTARAFGGQFTITSMPTSYKRLNHPLQAAFAPRSANVLLVTWTAQYRNKTLGDAFVCDAGVVNMALAALLNHAQDQFNLLDQKYASAGGAILS